MSDRGSAKQTKAAEGAAGDAQRDTIAFNAATPDQGLSGFTMQHAAAGGDEFSPKFGRYRLRRQLGSGGMASVYLADDEQLDRQVALKIPRVDGDDTGQLAVRLMREAKAVAALRHPNICPVYDVGQVDGVHFLAMAYIQGRPLSHYLQSSKLQTERAVALTVYKIALALQEAHSCGILHRDLKPANIMIDLRGEPIVMDFGLSYRLKEGAARLTKDGAVIGTPSYMAPEQIDNSSPIGVTTDVYALGVVLFELLTRRCPFQGSMVSVIAQVLHAPQPKVAEFRPDISPRLAAICERAMSRDPLLRHSSMKELAGALQAFIKGQLATAAMAESLSPLPEIGSVDALLSAPTVKLTPGGSLMQPRPEPVWPPHLIWIAAGIGVIVLALALYGLRTLSHWQSLPKDPTPVPSTPPPILPRLPPPTEETS